MYVPGVESIACDQLTEADLFREIALESLRTEMAKKSHIRGL